MPASSSNSAMRVWTLSAVTSPTPIPLPSASPPCSPSTSAKRFPNEPKHALAAKPAQGAQLYTPANLTPADTPKERDQSQAKAHANEHNERAAAHILLLREKGFNYSQIAEKLDLLRFVTRYGKPFRAEQVKRLYLRTLGNTPLLTPHLP
jgi:hypothetical protein